MQILKEKESWEKIGSPETRMQEGSLRDSPPVGDKEMQHLGEVEVEKRNRSYHLMFSKMDL